MSKESEAFRWLAHQAKGKAEGRSDAFCGLMLAIGDTYALLARVQEVIDDKGATYVAASRTTHEAT